MEKLKHKLLQVVSSGLFLIAIQSVNMMSKDHFYQEKEPESLKKYEKD
ncbi:MAG: cyclic lactone autoinducer peptide [Bacilli bacterium]|nr:cyclic lactone autoinducer peptide [Bacilli bacterium]